MDAFQEAFMYTPDIGALKDLTFFALGRNARYINDAINGKTLTYGQVMSYLKQYESTCQPGAIRSLVNQSVNKASDSGNGQTDVATSALQIAVQSPLTSDQVFYLYWLQSDKYLPTDDTLLAEKLSDIKKVFSNAVKIDAGIAKNLLSPYFKLFQNSLIDKWNVRIISEQAQAAKASAAKAPSAQAPSAQASAAQASAAQAPAAQAPTAQAPTAQAPAAQAPAAQASTAEAPTTEAPAAEIKTPTSFGSVADTTKIK
jgi:hypothetical protein